MAIPAIVTLLVPALVRGVVEIVSRKKQPTQADIETATTALVTAAVSDPAIKNATNSEPLYQSRTFLGSTAALLAALTVVVSQVDFHGLDLAAYDWDLMLPNLAVVLGAGFSIYGRVRSGLRPLFSRG